LLGRKTRRIYSWSRSAKIFKDIPTVLARLSALIVLGIAHRAFFRSRVYSQKNVALILASKDVGSQRLSGNESRLQPINITKTVHCFASKDNRTAKNMEQNNRIYFCIDTHTSPHRGKEGGPTTMIPKVPEDERNGRDLA
jgi:hypothetical protein